MKITRLETFRVPPRWLFLKIDTDAGISGWGEPILEGRAGTLEALVNELSEMLIGHDPRRINDAWQMLYRNGCYRGGPVLMSAISGIDQALWDITGKALGVPVHALLGGTQRDRVRSYIWIGGDRPRDLVAQARSAMEAGFTAVKMNICDELAVVDSHAEIDRIVTRLAELREAVGLQLDLAFDFHGRVHAPMARVLVRELEPLRPLFIEDAVAPGQLEALRELSRLTSTPLAVGERMHSRAEFKALFEARAAQVINPDPCHMGGITETIRIGAMAEAYDVALAPHCPLGPIALAACLQIDAVCHNAFIQEQSLGIHYNSGGDLLDTLAPESQFVCEDGFLHIPDGPGLGIVVDEDVVRDYAEKGHDWRAPVWRHKDGSIAEW
ncbi:galactonate dehydratase [Chelativorans sp. M5D2P16]|uniref:galactonate dehydratase n=1 Tax=Chelativorans sp. M5D2P16 TaxID=3095678 RepID=UPI002ACA5A8B|nr:galactonate dehydratase [Chelativorans sp. M5D2P16]MDZ5696572.1 galactonate dehydratase [Chelativorans sp. M5D2P16]